jgi:ribose transport system ATP-binding protein
LCSGSKILIFDEPTRGIDVGAKAEVFALMNQLTRDGVGIIMISSEMPEILAMADRILVMKDGRFTAEYPAGEATQEQLLLGAS